MKNKYFTTALSGGLVLLLSSTAVGMEKVLHDLDELRAANTMEEKTQGMQRHLLGDIVTASSGFLQEAGKELIKVPDNDELKQVWAVCSWNCSGISQEDRDRAARTVLADPSSN